MESSLRNEGEDREDDTVDRDKYVVISGNISTGMNGELPHLKS